MRSKEDLFRLIQAMSKSEKRYFTLDAQKTGKKGSKYLDLFKAINAMEEYDEAKLKKKFPKNLSTDKAYLYESIMKSLRDFNGAKSISVRVKELITDARFLRERGLYIQSEGRLKEAKDLAKSIDDQIALLEINREAREIAWITKRDYEKRIKELMEEKEISLQAVLDFFEYSDISSKLGIALKKNFFTSKPELVKELSERVSTNLATESPRAKRKHLVTQAISHRIIGNADEYVEHFSKIVDLWDSHPSFKNEEYFKYVNDVSNLLASQGEVLNFDSFPELINRMEQTNTSNLHLQAFIFQKVYLYRLLYLINTGQKHDFEKLEEGIKSGLDIYRINIASRIALMFNTAILLFMNERYQECSRWCKDIIKQSKNISRKDAQDAAYLLNLVATFEFMEIEDFEKEFRNTDRYFNTKDKVVDYELIKTTLELFKKIVNAPLLEVKQRYSNLKVFINSHHENNTNFIPMGIDELILRWVESKLTNKTVIQLCSEFKDEKLSSIK